jgi:hypothetical protein
VPLLLELLDEVEVPELLEEVEVEVPELLEEVEVEVPELLEEVEVEVLELLLLDEVMHTTSAVELPITTFTSPESSRMWSALTVMVVVVAVVLDVCSLMMMVPTRGTVMVWSTAPLTTILVPLRTRFAIVVDPVEMGSVAPQVAVAVELTAVALSPSPSRPTLRPSNPAVVRLWLPEPSALALSVPDVSTPGMLADTAVALSVPPAAGSGPVSATVVVIPATVARSATPSPLNDVAVRAAAVVATFSPEDLLQPVASPKARQAHAPAAHIITLFFM